MLFNETLGYNVKYGAQDLNASDEEVMEALRAAPPPRAAPRPNLIGFKLLTEMRISKWHALLEINPTHRRKAPPARCM